MDKPLAIDKILKTYLEIAVVWPRVEPGTSVLQAFQLNHYAVTPHQTNSSWLINVDIFRIFNSFNSQLKLVTSKMCHYSTFALLYGCLCLICVTKQHGRTFNWTYYKMLLANCGKMLCKIVQFSLLGPGLQASHIHFKTSTWCASK